MAERITLTGVRFTDETGRTRTMIPLRGDDGGWWSLDDFGAGTWTSPDGVRRFACELVEDLGADHDTIAGYLLLADVMEAIDG